MNVLWRRGPSSVTQVASRLPKLAYSTVLTILRILEAKGYVSHSKDGRAFVYRALVDRKDAERSAIRYILNRFFGDSAELLVVNVLENEKLDVSELRRLQRLVAEAGERSEAGER